MTRRMVLSLCAFGALLASMGCGGTNHATTDGRGQLRDVEISPLPGATFLPRTSEFTIYWSTGFEPPPTFTARIYTLRPDESIDELASSLRRPDPDAFRWTLEPTGDLPANAAIYVELSAPGEATLRFAYIIGSTRAATAPDSTRPGGLVAKRHVVQVR